jgi:serine/threonine-protein kinase
MRSGHAATALAVALSSLAVLAPARALAAGDDVATAQVLFDDARKLMAQHQYADACPKLAESQRLAPAIGTEFNLADCWEHQGKFASAWAAFLEVVDQTHKRGEAQRESVARARAAAIQPKLGRLTIQVPTSAPDEQVLRDGEAVRPEVWGVAVPVDAGDHRIEAHAPGRGGWSGTVHTSDGQSATIAVPDLPIAPSPPPEAAPTPPAATSPPVPAPGPVVTTTDHTAALLVLGTSVVFAGVGVLGILEHDSQVSAYNSDSNCPPIDSPTRPAHCNDLVSAADSWKTVGIVGFVGAGVALAAGVTLWVLAPRHSATSGAAAIGCSPLAGGLACRASF